MRKDYFNILEIKPTLNMSEVKTAFRKLIMQAHPDKNGGQTSEKVALLTEAWNYLQKEENLKAYYAYVVNDKPLPFPDTASSTQYVPSATVSEFDSQHISSDSLAVKGLKVKVFIPMYVEKLNRGEDTKVLLKKNVSPQTNTLTLQAEPYNAQLEHKLIFMQQVSHAEIEYADRVDFSVFARRISASTQRAAFYQVGLDEEEAKAIVNQHSYYKRHGDYIIVEAEVDILDLEERKSEKEVYGEGVLNAREGDYLSLKANTQIFPQNIIQVKFGLDARGLKYENADKDNRITLVNKQRSFEILGETGLIIQRIKEFIDNDSFWQNIANSFGSKFQSNSSKLLAITNLKNKFNEKSATIQLTDLKQVVNNYKNPTDRISFFNVMQPEITISYINEFLTVIEKANDWNDIHQWITHNSNLDSYLVTKTLGLTFEENSFDKLTKTLPDQPENAKVQLNNIFSRMGSYKVFHTILKVGKTSHDLKIRCTEKNYLKHKEVISHFTTLFKLHYMLVHKDQDRYHKEVANAFIEVLKALHNKQPQETYQEIINKVSNGSQFSDWKILGIKQSTLHPLRVQFNKLKDIPEEILQQVVPEYINYFQNIERWAGKNIDKKEREFVDRLNAVAELKPHSVQSVLALPSSQHSEIRAIEYSK